MQLCEMLVQLWEREFLEGDFIANDVFFTEDDFVVGDCGLCESCKELLEDGFLCAF